MNTIKQIANHYHVAPRALKRHVKESGLSPKKASRLEILEVLYINAPDLFFTRETEKGEVEYLDVNIGINLCFEMKAIREGKVHNEVKYV